MAPEYEEQIKKYVNFTVANSLAAIQDHLMEYYEGDHLAQNIAMDKFMGVLGAIQN
jgi:hypothetical protein